MHETSLFWLEASAGSRSKSLVDWRNDCCAKSVFIRIDENQCMTNYGPTTPMVHRPASPIAGLDEW